MVHKTGTFGSQAAEGIVEQAVTAVRQLLKAYVAVNTLTMKHHAPQ